MPQETDGMTSYVAYYKMTTATANPPNAGDHYWHPGPEWKTIGLVVGGAALVGLRALLYKMFDD